MQRSKGGGWGFIEPTTRSGRRRVRLSALALRELAPHRTRQLELRLKAGPLWQDYDLVLTTALGNRVDPARLSRAFQAHLVGARLPRIRFHDLRHTAATILLGHSISPRVVQEMLGHANPSITLAVYGHVTPDMQERAIAALDALHG